MSVEYHSDKGIEAANENYRMWTKVCRVGGFSTLAIAALLLAMFFTLV